MSMILLWHHPQRELFGKLEPTRMWPGELPSFRISAHGLIMLYLLRDTSNPPAQITNPIGQIILRSDFGASNPITRNWFLWANGDNGANFPYIIAITLASNFSILIGSYIVKVPTNIPARKDYVVVGKPLSFSQIFHFVMGTIWWQSWATLVMQEGSLRLLNIKQAW